MRILWLKTELLHPIDKGGRIRTYAMLRELRQRHHITYLCLDDGSGGADARAKAEAYCHALITVPFSLPRSRSAGFYGALLQNLFSDQPYAVAKHRSPAMTEAILRALAADSFDVVVCDFLYPSLNLPERLTVPTVLFQHNVEATIWERQAAVASRGLPQLYMRTQWRRMLEWERRECRRFDHVVAVSDADGEAMRTGYGIDHVSSVPTGVDTDFFTPSGTAARNPQEIVFTGSMDWMPNVDGIGWFCSEVMPTIHRSVPAATLSVVGRTPLPAVLALSSEHRWVTVTGTVPDVRPYLERAAVLIVPLRVGGGTRLKIFEGMAMSRPTVSTTIGAEGLPVHHDDDILIADSAEAFAAAVVRILRSPQEGDAIGARAARRVRAEMGWSRAADGFASICESVVAQARVSRRQTAGA